MGFHQGIAVAYAVRFIPEAVVDYEKLDGSVRQLVNKKLEELEIDPFLGERLGNKFNIDLTGFLKIYVAAKKYRIVYRILSPQKIEVLEIWGIGKRDKEEIYRIIGKRLGQ